MRYAISVRELCEFTAKQGDLDLRFTPSPTAQEGIAGHGKVAARRGGGYEREVSLSADYQDLRVRGRADGFDPLRGELEEIKTHRGDLSRIPDNHRALHRAQLWMYGAMLCQARGLSELRLVLVYFDLGRERETFVAETQSAQGLQAFFEAHCARFLAWATQQSVHRVRRDAGLEGLRFPFGDFHAGQRRLAEAVYRNATRGGRLMAEAPTGIGKTLGTLFPQLKACGRAQTDRIFFLTAKTSGRQLALDALARLQPAGEAPLLRVLELAAREKTCEHPDKACHGESCPLARGFYDRLPKARAAAAERAVLDRPALREIALAHEVCPYYLGQEMARWSDVVVGDYNYYFDASALLYALSLANGWKTAVLVDEAHNLLERGRAMYTSVLDQRQLDGVRAAAPAVLKRPLTLFNREWNRIGREPGPVYRVLDTIPQGLLDAAAKLVSALTEWLAEGPRPADPALQSFYFDLLHFRLMADAFGPHSLFDVTRLAGPRERTQLCVRNVVPAAFLSGRFEHAASVALFSATLSPAGFFRDMLGLPAEAQVMDVPSPFDARQLQVRVVRDVSTRFADRGRSLAPIAALMGRQYRAQPGNYLAYLSSYDYLDEVFETFTRAWPDIPAWRQSRRMSEGERAEFLARFVDDGQGIGFAVLGGAFGEGIDLPGRRLIGAFVATLGLPQVNPVNEQMRERIEALFGQGYDYTYLYPGLQKVAQAGGRVIRTPQDRGHLFLIDDRYARPSIRALLPRWWQPTVD